VRRIFISHSSRDNEAARSLKEYLEGHGHRSVFLDFDPADGIPAGRDWERELYQRVRTCQAMVVICSKDSMASRWCFMEITHARALGKLLLALKIDDCALDAVLTDRQAVDLTTDGERAYERILQGIAAAGLDPAATFPWDENRPPYPGLLAFQEEDAAIFFGRADEIAQGLELLNRLHHLGEPRVVMILGASGTGKSSLVRAGLVPRLKRDPERWIVIDPFRPRTNPMRELANVFNRHGWTDIAQTMQGRNDAGALAEALVAVRERANRPDAKVLLVVDQFEELLGTEEGMPFLAQLREVAQHKDGPAVILGTMRSDFLDRFQRSAPLLDLRYEVLSLGPMSESDIKEIIEEPAKEKDVELEESLVTALVRDAGTQNTLPLLAFTLRELWERFAGDKRLTLAEYRDELGGVQKVVGIAADNVMKSERVTREQEPALRAAFLAMMRVTDDGKYARRTVKWSDLPKTIHPLLERFVAARLLVSGNEGTEDTIEVAHERLFDSWEQLRGWINEDLEAIRLRADVESAAHTWDRSKTKDLLWRGARVSRARELLTAGKLLLDDVGRRFIDASHRAERMGRRIVIGAVSAFAIVAGTLAVIAFISAQNAKSSALQAADDAKVAEIQSLRAQAAQSFAESERSRTRAQTGSVSEDQKKILENNTTKYLEQSKQFQREAERRETELDEWRRTTKGVQANAPAALFTLEVLRAESGSAFLVHYDSPNAARHLLIDGGNRKTYVEVLKPRLDALRSDGKAATLSLVVSTQTDDQQVGGLTALIKDLQKKQSSNQGLKIDRLWSNGFVPGTPDEIQELVRVQPKAELIAGAKALQVPVNDPFTRMIAAPEAGAARVKLGDELTVTVLSPRVQWLRRFADFWMDELRKNVKRRDSDVVLSDYNILETFENPNVELIPSPIEPPQIENDPQYAACTDRSSVNLGSTVLMFELSGKRMLLTADACGDVIISALAQAGYTDNKGNAKVDVLVLPHGGSDHNVSVDFFRKVKARHYVMSADGRFKNPDLHTFEMLFEARRGDPTSFSIGLSYHPDEYKEEKRTGKYPLQELCALLAREKNAGTPFDIITPKKDQGSFGIDLLLNATFVDKGDRKAGCN
jgi:hypothetical protein